MALAVAVGRQHLKDPARDVDRGWIEHGVVVGEGNILEDHAVIVFVERGPAAVLALHGENPVDGALRRLTLVASVGMLHAAEAKANHRAIIDIGVKLIVKLEVPAARLSLRILDLPVAYVSDLLLQNPVSALHHARVVGRYSGFA